MNRNLFVSFELRDWLRQGGLIVAAIEELGIATRVFGTAWYVRTELSAEEAAKRIQDVLDPADGLLVIDTSQDAAALFNVEPHVVDRLRQLWHAGAESAAQSERKWLNRGPLVHNTGTG